MKLVVPAQLAEDVLRRTPQGVRGLKFVMLTQTVPDLAVAPRKGCVD